MRRSHPNPTEEFCNKTGAEKLKAKIEAYWRERGYEVQVDLHDAGFHPVVRAARYDLRSTMVNGMPRPALTQSEAA